MSQLKALKTLSVSSTKLPPTDVDFIIQSFPQLRVLGLENLGLTGEHLCSINGPLTLACTALPSTISNLKALTELQLGDNALTGEHSRSTNCASDPADTVACSCARVDWPASGARGPRSGEKPPDR